MNIILKIITQRINEIYLVYVIFGLSIAIFLKDINLTYLKIAFFEPIYFYRALLFLFSLYLFSINKKKFNSSIFFLSFISLIFLINSIFGEILILNQDKNLLFEQYNIKPHSFFSTEKINILIINFFNIYIPLLVLMLIKFNIDLNWFYKTSYKICEIFIIILTIYISITLFILLYQPEHKNKYFGFESDFAKHFINPHGLLYILNIFFIQNIIEIFNKSKIKKNLIYIILIIVLFLISGSILFFGLCAITLIVYSFFKLKKTYLYFSLILFFIYISIIYLNTETNNMVHGSLYNSISLRIAYIKMFLFEVNNMNYFFGSNIFSEKIYTYPHNSFIDIFICSGFVGIAILFFVFFKLLNLIKFKYQHTYFFIYLIFIQLLIFSLLSGFFFKNITLNILLAIIINLSNLREEKII